MVKKTIQAMLDKQQSIDEELKECQTQLAQALEALKSSPTAEEKTLLQDTIAELRTELQTLRQDQATLEAKLKSAHADAPPDTAPNQNPPAPTVSTPVDPPPQNARGWDWI